MATSADISGAGDFINIQKLDVSCGLCGWKDSRSVGWVSMRRDMSCPTCRSTIVLNTSTLRARIALLRRQVTQLQTQLAGAVSNAAFSPRLPAARRPAVPGLALASVPSHWPAPRQSLKGARQGSGER